MRTVPWGGIAKVDLKTMRIAVALIAPAFRGLAWTGPFSLVPHIRML